MAEHVCNMDIVSQVLEKAAKEAEKFKPINVEKHLELEYDLGTLLAIDTNDLDVQQLKSDSSRDSYLKDLARDNTQLLLNKIWELPTERVEEAIVAKLPAPTFVLPREKPVPKPKPLTRWQKFAKEKGITKTKKSKLTWDETLQKWVPRYGFKRSAAEKEKNWLLPVPEKGDPYEDQFSKVANTKTEKVAKNEFQRLRNLAKAKNIKVPRLGFASTDKLNSKQLGEAISVAKISTASIGKFQDSLPKEKRAKNIGPLLPSGKKRKLAPLNSAEERKSNINILDGILNKKPKLDIEKAVNKMINTEQQERSEEKKTQKKGSGKRRSGGKKGRGAGKQRTGAKPKGGKGTRKPREKTGRKRR
ncbi:ribosome biogenesis regulatory protein homolog [Periplaneta americana]|uniref:ribosome biogenesis regulatory protein homolog n=1 Tax=Periplaneta americana TaxID=6978 RepID=UPI0037E7938A